MEICFERIDYINFSGCFLSCKRPKIKKPLTESGGINSSEPAVGRDAQDMPVPDAHGSLGRRHGVRHAVDVERAGVAHAVQFRLIVAPVAEAVGVHVAGQHVAVEVAREGRELPGEVGRKLPAPENHVLAILAIPDEAGPDGSTPEFTTADELLALAVHAPKLVCCPIFHRTESDGQNTTCHEFFSSNARLNKETGSICSNWCIL